MTAFPSAGLLSRHGRGDIFGCGARPVGALSLACCERGRVATATSVALVLSDIFVQLSTGFPGCCGRFSTVDFFRRQTEATVLQKPFLLTLWKAGRTQGYSWRVREIDLPEDCLPRNPRNLRRTSRTVSFDAALTSYTRCLLTPFLVRVLWSSPELPDLLTPAFDPRSCADRHWASAFGCESCIRMVASCGASTDQFGASISTLVVLFFFERALSTPPLRRAGASWLRPEAPRAAPPRRGRRRGGRGGRRAHRSLGGAWGTQKLKGLGTGSGNRWYVLSVGPFMPTERHRSEKLLHVSELLVFVDMHPDERLLLFWWRLGRCIPGRCSFRHVYNSSSPSVPILYLVQRPIRPT